jgi:hypothetical protein
MNRQRTKKGAWQSQTPSMLRLECGAIVLIVQPLISRSRKRCFQDRAGAYFKTAQALRNDR